MKILDPIWLAILIYYTAALLHESAHALAGELLVSVFMGIDRHRARSRVAIH